MKIRKMKGNEKGQVLGLPMYLIIIMIVAVAVIAAVIFMLPQGTEFLSASVTSGGAQASSGIGANNEATFSPFPVSIKVVTNDDERNPIMGASVTLSGCHTAATSATTTDANGELQLTVSNAYLNAGVNTGYIKLTVKSPNYDDYEDLQAITLVRS